MRKRYAAMFFLGMLLVMVTVACEKSARSADGSSGEVNGTPVAVAKVVGSFYPIEGTHYQLATISTSQNESGRGYDLSNLFSYGRSDYSVYNYVFLDVDTETAYALLPTNDNAILSIQGYPTPSPAEPLAGEKTPVAWWLYTLVKQDTNQDDQLSYLDKQTLAISDVGGKGYTEIIPNVDQVLGNVLKNETILLIIYSSDHKNYLAHIDLPGRVVTKTTELPDFGVNLK